MTITPMMKFLHERSLVTAFLFLDSKSSRVLIVVAVVVIAFVLHYQGQELATALLLATALIGAAVDIANRAVLREVR
ncbi:hypothetical protein [Nocardiopsis sp. TNDT3]|uniref:hypothetical protein n=1 Tax=Nocardiopsis sp. TNDT3 TaxID=2249354 RepID=UPI001E29A143|nr:hypothetical protein [Nocardiopsis sp. TNDT3]